MIRGDHRARIWAWLDWAAEFGLIVVSVEYRPAPEHPGPAPAEDCYAGLLWTAEHAEELGIDPARLLIAGGGQRRRWRRWPGTVVARH
ncbi:alpha/beta hydrolase fold domain-containing protein [Streptomyces phaeochromogenes]|uniref:alpha/beta hydrolase fold domain-containing protein n=1 Tax=Streptomyces phaeochromogenes TaxID=1923 RepID=UPI002DDC2403|nr:alpha/beta hydrolase fold domain-containing protein [Streptomyces phaeochromogenes]